MHPNHISPQQYNELPEAEQKYWKKEYPDCGPLEIYIPVMIPIADARNILLHAINDTANHNGTQLEIYTEALNKLNQLNNGK